MMLDDLLISNHFNELKYMMKKLLFICFTLSALAADAQINMTIQTPPAGVLLKNQLWNILLVSASNENELVTINLTLQDIETNQILLAATSRTITLKKGATQFQARDFAPIQYTYYSSIFNSDRDPNGMLPAGNYLACYTVIGGHNITLSENCISVSVKPLSPPLLNSPGNESVLQTNYPQFTWLPPTPKNMFSDLNYDFILAEVLPGQTSNEAIQNNVPVYTSGRLKDIFLNYPASYKQLDTAKLYAWQIIARNGNSFIAPSDVWTFKIKTEKPTSPTSNTGNYVLLQRSGELRGTYTIESNNLSIKYYSFDKDHETEVRFLTADRKTIKTIKQRIVYGDNYLNYKLNKSFRKAQIYFIEIRDKQNTQYTASFRIK